MSVNAFLSHNHADREVARQLAAQMTLAGAYVWLDDWRVGAGDSISSKVNDALASVDTLVLAWSTHARRSPWVRSELDAAISRAMSETSFRIITVKLDATPVPPLLAPLKWVDLQRVGLAQAVNEIMGFDNDHQRLKAIQETLDASGIEVKWFEGYGPVVCCPRCGASVDRLSAWLELDGNRDDLYAGVQCEVCGFNDGAEV